jgi:hypothetical protein
VHSGVVSIPPSPLAHLLETVREVRLALAYVPQLCADLKWTEAAEVVEEQLVQLHELEPLLAALRDEQAARAVSTAVAYAGAARVLIDLDRQERLEVQPGALSGPEGPPSLQPPESLPELPLW